MRLGEAFRLTAQIALGAFGQFAPIQNCRIHCRPIVAFQNVPLQCHRKFARMMLLVLMKPFPTIPSKRVAL